MSIELKDLEKQKKYTIEMGGHLKHFAETYDMDDDQERHNLRLVCEAYAQEQTKYENMKMQATPGAGA